jgi:hypothetical protein
LCAGFAVPLSSQEIGKAGHSLSSNRRCMARVPDQFLGCLLEARDGERGQEQPFEWFDSRWRVLFLGHYSPDRNRRRAFTP